MAPYFISFNYFHVRNGLGYGSRVVDLPNEPLTAQAILNLQTIIGMEFGVMVNILNWDFLPDSTTHPSGGSPYVYHVGYHYLTLPTLGGGQNTFIVRDPICDISGIRWMEDVLHSRLQASDLALISCKAIREALPEDLQRYYAR